MNKAFPPSKISFIVATGFGLGLIKKAPGTFGSLLALPLGLALQHFSLPMATLIFFLLCLACIPVIATTEKQLGEHDSSKIVIDEILGGAIPVYFFSQTALQLLLCFLLFRLFDIVKKGPVGYVDKNVGGALGVLLDDLVAGAMAAVVLFAVYSLI